MSRVCATNDLSLSPGIEESSLTSRSRAYIEPTSSAAYIEPASSLDVEAPMGVKPVTMLRRIEASSLDVEVQHRGVEP